MSPTESARHALYSRLKDVLGPDHADTLMTALPHSDDFASKGDIATVGNRLDRVDGRLTRIDDRLDRMDDRFDRMEDRFDRLEERLDRMQRFYVGTTVGSMTALTVIFSLVVTFLGN